MVYFTEWYGHYLRLISEKPLKKDPMLDLSTFSGISYPTFYMLFLKNLSDHLIHEENKENIKPSEESSEESKI